jgi:hypothetical protein
MPDRAPANGEPVARLDELPIFSGDGDNVEDTGEVLYAGAIT